MTERIYYLKARLARLEQIENDAHYLTLGTRDELDAARIEQRPTYPTDIQRDGIAAALAVCNAGTKPETHHGDPAIPGVATYVHVDGARPWLRVKAGAPYSVHRNRGYLWDFTDDEIEAILNIVRAAGWTPQHWRADNGLSMNLYREGEGE